MPTAKNIALTPKHKNGELDFKSRGSFTSPTLSLSLPKAILSLALLSILLTGCGQSSPAVTPAASETRSQQVTAVGYPLACFANQLVDNSVEVLTLTPPEGPLASWKPSRDQISSMQKSDVIFINGSSAPFASWRPRVTLPESKICATANEGLKLADMIAVEDIQIVHSHGPEGEHSHATMVAYPWLDPAMAVKQVGIMADRLTTTYPEMQTAIANAKEELTSEFDLLSATIRQIQSQTKKPTNVLTGSPDLKFLTRALGLNDIHLNWAESPNASQAEIQLKEKLASAQPRPKLMLFAHPPTAELRSVVESMDLKVIMVSKMAREPVGSDYFSVMNETLARLKLALQIDSDSTSANLPDSEQN